MANILDTTISKLKKRNEPKPIPLTQKENTTVKVVDLLWEKVVGFFSDITAVIIKANYDVTVKNFPKVQKVEITNPNTLLPPQKDNSLGIVTSLKALQQTIIDKPVTSIPEIQKVQVTNQVKSEKIEFPDKMRVEMLNTKDITMAIDSLSNKLASMKQEKPDDNKGEHFEKMLQALEELKTTIEDNKTNEVVVTNMGSFPVVFPIPAYRDINGNPAQGRLDVNGYVKVSLQPAADALASYLPADSDESTATKYYGFVDPDGAWYILRDTGTAYRYTKGGSDYPTNWTNRDSLSFDYYNIIF